MAYDFLNKVLNIGDEVVFMQVGYRSLRTGKIISMGKKKATISYGSQPFLKVIQFFDQLVKI